MIAFGITNKSTWDEIAARYGKLRRRNFSVELDRALFLRWLVGQEPWKDKKRYATTSAWAYMRPITWEYLVTDYLGENLIEVENTLEVLTAFGEEKFKKWGRDNLLAILNKTEDVKVQDRILEEASSRSLIIPGTPSHTTVRRVICEMVPSSKGASPTISMVASLKKMNACLQKKVGDLTAKNRALTEEAAQLAVLVVSCPRCSRQVSRLKSVK